MKNKDLFKLFGILVSGLLTSGSSYAAMGTSSTDAHSAYIGGMLGFVSVSDNGGTHVPFGIDAGYMLSPEIGVGAYLNYFSSGASTPGLIGGTSTSFTTVAAEGNYYFPTLTGLRAGAKAGLGFSSVSATPSSQSNSSTNLLIGPSVGYEHPLGSGFSVGGEGNVLFVTSSNSSTITNVLALLKYNFI